MVYKYNRILLSFTEKGDFDTHYVIEEHWRHHAKWNKPDTEGQISYDPTHMVYPADWIHWNGSWWEIHK